MAFAVALNCSKKPFNVMNINFSNIANTEAVKVSDFARINHMALLQIVGGDKLIIPFC